MIIATRVTLICSLFLAVACGRDDSQNNASDPITTQREMVPIVTEMKSALETCKNRLRGKGKLLGTLLSALAKGKGVLADQEMEDGSRGMEAGARGGACLKALIGKVDVLKQLVDGGIAQRPEAQRVISKLLNWIETRRNRGG